MVSTLRLFQSRHAREAFHSVLSETELRATLLTYALEGGEEALHFARGVYQSGDKAAGLARLAELAVKREYDHRIPVTIAELLVNDNRATEAYRILLTSPDSIRDHPEVRNARVKFGMLCATRIGKDAGRNGSESGAPEHLYERAAFAMQGDDIELALTCLIELLALHPESGDKRAAEAALVLSDALGANHPLASRARHELASARP